MIENEKIIKDPKDFKIFIGILTKISINHYRKTGFINAINHIILKFKDEKYTFILNENLIFKTKIYHFLKIIK